MTLSGWLDLKKKKKRKKKFKNFLEKVKIVEKSKNPWNFI